MANIAAQPTNPNLLSKNKFQLSFKRMPNMVFFLADFQLPSVSMDVITQHSPFAPIPLPGNKIKFDDWSCKFHVDEDMAAYMEVFNWLTDLGFPDDFSGYPRLKAGDGLTSDATVTILNSKNNPHLQVTFVDMFPFSLPTLNFTNTVDPGDLYLQCETFFHYRRFYMSKII